MITDQELRNQLPFVLSETNFSKWGERYEGKVRDNYARGDKRVLITTDRLSCFDRVVTTIPFKGQVLTQMAVEWFKRTSSIITNHIIDLPDPNVMIVRSCKILPIEVVVRGFLTGSAWRDYQAGSTISGIRLPAGLANYSQLPEVLLTPSTKAERGMHDQPISEAEIASRGVVQPRVWAQVREAALALFAEGTKYARESGLILVDTKYEFGLVGEELILADEIHTLDSSRYWVAESYQERLVRGESPVMLDKEPVRQWLLAQGFKGDGTIPNFSDEYRIEIARHYLDAFEKIVGRPLSAAVGDVAARIAAIAV